MILFNVKQLNYFLNRHTALGNLALFAKYLPLIVDADKLHSYCGFRFLKGNYKPFEILNFCICKILFPIGLEKFFANIYFIIVTIKVSIFFKKLPKSALLWISKIIIQ